MLFEDCRQIFIAQPLIHIIRNLRRIHMVHGVPVRRRAVNGLAAGRNIVHCHDLIVLVVCKLCRIFLRKRQISVLKLRVVCFNKKLFAGFNTTCVS